MKNPIQHVGVSPRHTSPPSILFFTCAKRRKPLGRGEAGHGQMTLECFPVKNRLLMMECSRELRIRRWRHPTNRRWVAEDRQNRRHQMEAIPIRRRHCLHPTVPIALS